MLLTSMEFTNVSPTFFALGLEIWGIPVAAAGILGCLWGLKSRSNRSSVLDVFFHHRDRNRRRKELRMLWLALGLGLVLAVFIAGALYVLNVTNRL